MTRKLLLTVRGRTSPAVPGGLVKRHWPATRDRDQPAGPAGQETIRHPLGALTDTAPTEKAVFVLSTATRNVVPTPSPTYWAELVTEPSARNVSAAAGVGVSARAPNATTAPPTASWRRVITPGT
jgi:hypothetical protein